MGSTPSSRERAVSALVALTGGSDDLARDVVNGIITATGEALIRASRASKSPQPSAPVRDWETVDEARLGRYRVTAGSPVAVLGEGRKTEKNPEGAAQDGWTVLRIERHRTTGKVNVEVRRERTGHSRTFPISKIVYRRRK